MPNFNPPNNKPLNANQAKLIRYLQRIKLIDTYDKKFADDIYSRYTKHTKLNLTPKQAEYLRRLSIRYKEQIDKIK